MGSEMPPGGRSGDSERPGTVFLGLRAANTVLRVVYEKKMVFFLISVKSEKNKDEHIPCLLTTKY